MLGVLRRGRLGTVEAVALRRPVLGPLALGLTVVALTAGLALLWGAADIPATSVVGVILPTPNTDSPQ